MFLLNFHPKDLPQQSDIKTTDTVLKAPEMKTMEVSKRKEPDLSILNKRNNDVYDNKMTIIDEQIILNPNTRKEEIEILKEKNKEGKPHRSFNKRMLNTRNSRSMIIEEPF